MHMCYKCANDVNDQSILSLLLLYSTIVMATNTLINPDNTSTLTLTDHAHSQGDYAMVSRVAIFTDSIY